MASQDLTMNVAPAPAQAPAQAGDREPDVHCSARSWGVEERGWKQLLPDLPDDVIALLAPPIVVTARMYEGLTATVTVAPGATPVTVAPVTAAAPAKVAPAKVAPVATAPVATASGAPTAVASPVRRGARNRARH